MKALLLAVLLMAALPAAAQVRVTSGEHDGFTRIVLQGAGLAGWTLQRNGAGYDLRLRTPVALDLSRAFDLIGRQRVGGLAPLSGQAGLSLSVACACHAIAFDLRSGVVVIDLRDGPPPDGSSFELAADGTRLPPLAAIAQTPSRPRPRPAAIPFPRDWIRQALDPPAADLPVSFAMPSADAAALRMALLREFGRGVADGLVDPVTRPPDPAAKDAPPPAGILLRDGEGVGLEARLPRDAPDLTADGRDCPADAQVLPEGWGDPALPAHLQLSTSMSRLLGEFDRPDPAHVTAAIRLRLWLGFGAEAASMADAFGADLPDAPLWRAMALIVDGRPVADSPFAGMQSCDGAAALWAVLADPAGTAGAANAVAVQRSFSALPAHLRAHLGPELARRFLAAGDGNTAQVIRRAMARGGEEGDQVIDAELALAKGDAKGAETLATALVDKGGAGQRAALVALVAARAAQGAAIEVDELTALESFHAEAPDHSSGEALVLARALAGDFDGAFALVADYGGASARLWSALAQAGPDSALIAHAILSGEAPPDVPPDTRRIIADRLTALGFGTAALSWLGEGAEAEAAARAELARGDADAALRRLGPARGEAADRLRAEALARLGNPAAAATILADVDQAAAAAARLRARQWDRIGPDAPAPWQSVAGRLAPLSPEGGPLARGRRLAEESAATRAEVEALLSGLPALTESQGSQP